MLCTLRRLYETMFIQENYPDRFWMSSSRNKDKKETVTENIYANACSFTKIVELLRVSS